MLSTVIMVITLPGKVIYCQIIGCFCSANFTWIHARCVHIGKDYFFWRAYLFNSEKMLL